METLKVILKTKGVKHKHQSQIISTKTVMWEAWKGEATVCYISLFCKVNY